jgi:hypothetical protein
MLALITIFLITFTVSATAVWLYRRITSWGGFSTSVVGRTRPASRMRIELQQGFISLVSSPRKQAKTVKLRVPRGGIKTPWGW